MREGLDQRFRQAVFPVGPLQVPPDLGQALQGTQDRDPMRQTDQPPEPRQVLGVGKPVDEHAVNPRRAGAADGRRHRNDRAPGARR